jgi:hypothetical protein
MESTVPSLNGSTIAPPKNQPRNNSTSPARAEQIGGDHYNKYAIQPIDYIMANKLEWCEGNVVKYITRWKDKGGLQDLLKARHYLDLLIERQ